jgi:hypothetical protein
MLGVEMEERREVIISLTSVIHILKDDYSPIKVSHLI